MKVCCVFSLESPHRGDSSEYTQYTVFNINKKITKFILNLQLWDFSNQTAVVNKPSVFEPLKFYCNTMIGLLLKEIICSQGSKFFSLRTDPYSEARQKIKQDGHGGPISLT